MKAFLIALVAVTAAPAFAQVRVQVHLPSIVFPAPPHLVVVTPGVQVVEDNDDEVFFADNYYWHRRDGTWFRTRTHTGGWEFVEPRYVPRGVYSIPEGRYRRWHHVEQRHDQRRDFHPGEERHEGERHEGEEHHEGGEHHEEHGKGKQGH